MLDVPPSLVEESLRDVDNLLAIAMHATELLERHLVQTDPQTRLLLQMASSAINRGAGVTHRFRSIVEHHHPAWAAVSLQKVIGELIDILKPQLDFRVSMTCDCAEDLPNIRNAEPMLMAALMDVLMNARDSLPEGGTIRVAASIVPSGELQALGLHHGNYVRVVVSHEAIDVGRANAEPATFPFYAPAALIELRLASVRAFARRSGGAFRVRGLPGAATCAELYLPQV